VRPSKNRKSVIKSQNILAYACLLIAMLIVSGNFIFGNRAVQEIPAFTLVFWRTSIGALFLLPLALLSRGHIIEFIKQNKLKTFALVLSGLVLRPWFVYMALNSPKLTDISVGVLAVPLMTIIFSVFLLNERLSYLQILGLILAFFGSAIFAFHGDLEHLRNFDPHIEFLWILVASTFGSLYLVLLKRWDVHPSPSEGLFGLLLVATIILLPGFIHHAMTDLHPLEYSRGLWGSVLFVGIGMGGLYLFLMGYVISRIGATTASLFTLIIPALVAVESVLFLNSSLHIYQAVGGLLVATGVLFVLNFRPLPATESPATESPATEAAIEATTE